jgi:hypothetical protein
LAILDKKEFNSYNHLLYTHKGSLEELENNIQYRFKNKALLFQAISSESFTSLLGLAKSSSNEQLEYGLIVPEVEHEKQVLRHLQITSINQHYLKPQILSQTTEDKTSSVGDHRYQFIYILV